MIVVDDDEVEGGETITFTSGEMATLVQAGTASSMVMTIGDNDETVITGLDDLQYLRKIYPNPTSDVLYILEAEEFYDLTGKIVAAKSARNGFMDISRLPAGIYNLLLTGIMEGGSINTGAIITR